MGTKKYRGGSGSNPSAWSYVYNTVGDGLTQFRNALTVQSGDNAGSLQSNDIEPVNNLNAQNAQGVPNNNQLSLVQSAGKKGRRGRRGGNMGFIMNQALAPVSLLALQQGYSKKHMKRSNSKSRRSRGGSKRRRRGGNMGLMMNQALAPVSLLALQQTYGKKTRRSKSRKSRRSRK